MRYGVFLFRPNNGPTFTGSKRQCEHFGNHQLHPRLQLGGWEVRPMPTERASRFWAYLGVVLLLFVGFMIASCIRSLF